jgi:formylglycine-generating enzyme
MGTYSRTYTNSGTGATGEADTASVSGFQLDKYLVTVGRFRRFVAAWNGGAGYTPPAKSGKHTHLNAGKGLTNSGSAGGYESGWDADWNKDIAPTKANLACDTSHATWTNSNGGNENLPINCVNWYESYAFCIWEGGFLPSEAEWEYAAAGGGDPSGQLEYPWGSTDPGMGNQYAIYDSDYGGDQIAPVGTATMGAGIWGQLDMAGEVFEWSLDGYAAYAACTDCAYLATASDRVIRGGSFDNAATRLLPPNRDLDAPMDRNASIGVRCARTP